MRSLWGSLRRQTSKSTCRPALSFTVAGTSYTIACRQGLQVDLGFFSDLHVPDYHCPEDYWFHSQDGLWAWKYEGNDLYLDLKEEIRYGLCPLGLNDAAVGYMACIVFDS